MVLGLSACSPTEPDPADTSAPEVTEPADTSAPEETEPQETQAEQEEQEPQESVEPTADTEPAETPASETPAQEEVTEPPAQQASSSEAQASQSTPSTPDENISYGGADGGWGSPDTGSQTTQQPSGNGNSDAMREWIESHGGEAPTVEESVDVNDPDYRDWITGQLNGGSQSNSSEQTQEQQPSQSSNNDSVILPPPSGERPTDFSEGDNSHMTDEEFEQWKADLGKDLAN